MREVIDPCAGIGHAHLAQELGRLFQGLLGRKTVVDPERFRDLLADGHQRVEVRGRVLKDHADLAPAHAPHLVLGEPGDVVAVEADGAAADAQALAGQEADDSAAGERLARAALAHEPQDLAFAEGERDAVHGAQRARRRHDLDRQVLDLENVSHYSLTPSFSPRPSARRLKPRARQTMARPGKVVIHQAVKMKFCPSAIITPHSAVGG